VGAACQLGTGPYDSSGLRSEDGVLIAGSPCLATTDLGIDASGVQQAPEVINVTRQHHVVIANQEGYMGVDDVGRCCRTAQLAGEARHPAVQPRLPHAGQQARQKDLTGPSLPPGLSHAAGRRHHAIASPSGGLHQGRNLPVAAIEGDEAACVKH